MLRSFKFSAAPVPTFTGFAFYMQHKNAEFLQDPANVETILSQGHQLRHRLKDVSPGQYIVVSGMNLSRKQPLKIKRSGPKVEIEDHEFTYNRLTGLTAAYVYEHRGQYLHVDASEPAALGLSWDNTNQEKCRLFLAAVSGTEHFYEQFKFYPLICALRKMRLGKLPAELVVKIARVKNQEGHRMIQLLQRQPKLTAKMWSLFPGSTPKDLERILKTIDK